jgi:hypothetical protein
MKRIVRPDAPESELTPAPPSMRDIVWRDCWEEGFKKPVKYSGKLSKMPFAQFLRRNDFDYEVVRSMFHSAPHEAWRSFMLTQMRFELQDGPRPSWMEIETHYHRRIRTMDEEKEGVVYQQAVYKGEEEWTPRKKETKRDRIDARYRALIKALEGK